MRTTRALTCAFALLFACRAFGDAAFVRDTREYFSRLEKLGFAGVVLVARDGQPLFAEGYGLADREHATPWTPATVSCIGSITKQFTAAAILRLAEENRLRLDDPLTKHFDNVPEDKRAITLHQLLTHSSGIVDLEGAGDWDPIERDEFVRRIFAQPLAFAPGSGYEYSNAGYSILGALIEKLTGVSYEQHLRERFFVPLAMYETGYILPQWGERRLAQGYRETELWGTTLGRPMAPDGPYWVLRGNGGIHMTAWDMLRWVNALLDGRAMPADSRKLLWTPHVREHAGEESFYGYGWSVQEHAGVKVVTHNGSNGIFYSDLAVVPENRTVVFLMTNVFSGNRYIRTLLENIGLRLAAGRPYPDVPRIAESTQENSRELEGTWTLESGGRIRVTAAEGTVIVEPLDPQAFARMFSTTPEDAAERKRADQRAARLLAAARGIVREDYTPLHRLYGSDITLERLREVWSERRKRFTDRLGAVRDAEVLGAARRGDRLFMPVRFTFERGTELVTFVWTAGENGKLLGISGTNIEPRVTFRPEGNGRWAAFDRESGAALRLRVEDGRLIGDSFAGRRAPANK